MRADVDLQGNVESQTTEGGEPLLAPRLGARAEGGESWTRRDWTCTCGEEQVRYGSAQAAIGARVCGQQQSQQSHTGTRCGSGLWVGACVWVVCAVLIAQPTLETKGGRQPVVGPHPFPCTAGRQWAGWSTV
jgi:hypothetical protein